MSNDITVKKSSEIAPYSGPHAIPGIRFRPAREALGVSSWGMNVIEIDADCSQYPEHDHADEEHEEVYLVMEGSVVLLAAGAEHVLERGDMVRVAPQVKRKLVTRAQHAVVLALGGTPGQAYGGPSMGQG